jgi:hypothetical protein
MTSNCLIREVGSRTRKRTAAMLIYYSSATGRSSFGAEDSNSLLSVSPHYWRRLLAPPEPMIPRNLRLRHPEVGHCCQRRLIDPAVEATA